MHLTPCKQETLLIGIAANVSRHRRDRGLKLNHTEAVALLTAEPFEGARDGRTMADAWPGGHRQSHRPPGERNGTSRFHAADGRENPRRLVSRRRCPHKSTPRRRTASRQSAGAGRHRSSHRSCPCPASPMRLRCWASPWAKDPGLPSVCWAPRPSKYRRRSMLSWMTCERLGAARTRYMYASTDPRS